MCNNLKDAIMVLGKKRTVNKDMVLLFSKTAQDMGEMDIKLKRNTEVLEDISSKIGKLIETDFAFRAVLEEKDKKMAEKIDGMSIKIDEKAEKAAQMDLVEAVVKNKYFWFGILLTVLILIGANIIGIFDKVTG